MERSTTAQSLPLFDDRSPAFRPVARSRNTDPRTSFAAALAVEASGGADTQRRRCLQIVRYRPGLTAAEVAELAGLERHVPSRRLPELREACLVSNGPARMCRVMRRRSLTWWPG